MANVKTAISLDKAPFCKATQLAEELQLSRSGLFAIAIAKLIREHENRKITEAFNAVYQDYTPEPDEQLFFDKMREYQGECLKESW